MSRVRPPAGFVPRHDEGMVRVLGRDFTETDDRGRRAFFRRELGVLCQAAGMVPGLTAIENVELSLYTLGDHKYEVQRRTRESLEPVGLGARAGHQGEELSCAERQWVALAMALAKQARWLLADQPTSQLDAESGLAAIQLLKVASSRGRTVVTATHDQSIVEVADHQSTLVDGKVMDRL